MELVIPVTDSDMSVNKKIVNFKFHFVFLFEFILNKDIAVNKKSDIINKKVLLIDS